MDAVIEIKQSSEAWEGITNCNGDCDILWNSSVGRVMRWAAWIPNAKTRTGHHIGYWKPTDKCPGPGRYPLVSLEDFDKLIKGLKAVRDLIAESHGVDGLHLNGDVVSWAELRTGGHFEDWLMAFDDALDVVKVEEE